MSARHDSAPVARRYRFDRPPAIVVGACAHGLAVIRALRAGGVPVIALEANPAQPGARTSLAPVELVADINGLGLVRALQALRERIESPAGRPVLFLTNDTMVRTLTTEWPRLEGLYALSWSRDRERVRQLVDKRNLEATCAQQGNLYPSTFLITSEHDVDAAFAVTGERLIIKPAKPLSSFKTARPNSREACVALVRQHEKDLPFLAQRYIPGDDRSIFFSALYLNDGEVLARFDGHKLRSRPMGHTTVAEPFPDDQVFAATTQFFAGMRLTGPVSLELKRDVDGSLWVIEPTIGRTDFWIGLCTVNGVNLPLVEYLSQTGAAVPAQTQRDEALWFNEERDPMGRLWVARHHSMRGRRSSFLYFHSDDLRPIGRYLSLRASALRASVWRRLGGGKSPQARLPANVQVACCATVDGLGADALQLMSTLETERLEYGEAWTRLTLAAALPAAAEPRIYTLRVGGRLRVVLPLMKVRDEHGGSRIEALSTFYFSVYTPWFDRADPPSVVELAELIRVVRADSDGAATWHFGPMDPELVSYSLLMSALRRAGLFAFSFFRFGNWYQPCTAWAQYWSERPTRLKNTVQRKRRRLELAGGRLQILTDPGPALEQAIAGYLLVYAKSWKTPEPFPSFVPDLIRTAAARGWLRMGIVWMGDQAVAAQLWFVFSGRAQIFKLAYDERFKYLSAGSILTATLMQHVFEHDRVSEVDYLLGDDRYKRDWMSARRERWGIQAYDARRWRGLLGLLRELSGRGVKRMLQLVRPKQLNPREASE